MHNWEPGAFGREIAPGLECGGVAKICGGAEFLRSPRNGRKIANFAKFARVPTVLASMKNGQNIMPRREFPGVFSAFSFTAHGWGGRRGERGGTAWHSENSERKRQPIGWGQNQIGWGPNQIGWGRTQIGWGRTQIGWVEIGARHQIKAAQHAE